ncbi:MAG TPA: serine hydrolase domain-containing protein [Anaerolineales bacterium]|nr:serine hydrolase domain-containing protein [Anaerolineales bacterium]
MLNEMAEQNLFSGSVLIAREGEILLSNGYGMADREKNIANTPQTKFYLGSITKQFTAMAILMLQAEGKLNVQDRICQYISDCPAAWHEITIHQLLIHTSGIPHFMDFPLDRPSTSAQTIARIKDKPLDFKPGEKWSYSGSGYNVLGYIIEQVTGKRYEVFLEEKIFEPLKMIDTGYAASNDNLAVGYENNFDLADNIDISNLYASGGLYSTVEDLYRWDQALYTEKLISKEVLDAIFTSYITIPPESNGESYGYGWVIAKKINHRWIGHEGVVPGFASEIDRYPDDKVTIILLSNEQDTSLLAITSAIAKKVLGEE